MESKNKRLTEHITSQRKDKNRILNRYVVTKKKLEKLKK